jgi:6-phosphogluconolactonase
MIDRRTFTTLLGSAVIAPELSPTLSWGQAAKRRTVLYSAVGPELTLYSLSVDDATLARRSTVTLPSDIQYAWPHPSRQYLYVAAGARGARAAGERHFVHAFRIDPATGALAPHGEPQSLPSRPVHTSVDMAGEYLLTAHNEPSSLTVHRINRDGTLGERIAQPNPLDTGKYAHQIRATSDNRNVILVTRGNNAPGDNPVNPGSLKIFSFKAGVLTNLAAIQPGDGMRFGPRHLDFHPTQPWVYVSIESQSKLYVYRREPATGLAREPLFVKETLSDPSSAGPRQHAGTIHVHPNGRFVYLTNRDSGTIDVDGKKVSAGGQNNVAVFAIDQATGEPTLIQTVDGHAIELRTFAIDPSARMLVAASIQPMPVRDGGTIKALPAGLSVFRMADDGKLDFVRKYDVDVGANTQFWSGMVTLA